jgi:hypothetical protein
VSDTDPNEVYWCERIWYWPYYGFCPNEHAWYEEMKRSAKWIETSGHAAIPEWPDPVEASVTRLRVSSFSGEKGKLACVVTINSSYDDRPIDTIVGMIAHEAAHVFGMLCDEIGEDKPSPEFIAYTMQSITQQLLTGYLVTRRRGEFITSESKTDDAPTDAGTVASDSLHTARPDPAPLSPPEAAAPTVSLPRRRKAVRRPRRAQ